MRIVICEAGPTIALDLWQLLQDQGHSICGVARNTTDCLGRVAQSRPDLVMVDDDLREGLTGLSLVETLAMTGFPCVVISGRPRAAMRRSSARGVLKKPVSGGPLAALMARVDRQAGAPAA